MYLQNDQYVFFFRTSSSEVDKILLSSKSTADVPSTLQPHDHDPHACRVYLLFWPMAMIRKTKNELDALLAAVLCREC
jgi:hypothetical protein